MQFVNCIFVEQEVRGDDITALDSVVNADRERAWLMSEEKVKCVRIHESLLRSGNVTEYSRFLCFHIQGINVFGGVCAYIALNLYTV